jgi:hypothetical protein
MRRRIHLLMYGVAWMGGFAAGLLASSGVAAEAQDADPLVTEFEQPPPAARPYVWWHWMDGNVTQDGIQRDLEWMHRVGIGGLQVVDVSFGTPISSFRAHRDSASRADPGCVQRRA